ncbi:MAG TPA: DUF6429 family protein [Gammaproteobacteria bacterium]|nr:DUF6429 family protein [Gammaproteobacteria bacterium]
MGMEIETKIDELVLALMTLNTFDDGKTIHAKKSFDDSLVRLQEKNYIHGSDHKSKSVVFTTEGLARAKEYFKKHISDNG